MYAANQPQGLMYSQLLAMIYREKININLTHNQRYAFFKFGVRLYIAAK